MAMALKEKVRRDDRIDNLVMEDANERPAALAKAAVHINTAATDESATCTDDAVKVGRKRAYHETEDPNSSLAENNKDLSKTKQTTTASDIERINMESDSKASSSTLQEKSWLESARAEMGEVREENERLKRYLGQMMKDYEALQMKFYQVVKQEETKKSTVTVEENIQEEETEETDELVSLSLGRFSSKTDGKTKTKKSSSQEEEYEKPKKRELSLALDSKFEAVSDQCDIAITEANRSPVNSFEEADNKDQDHAAEICPPNKPTVPNGEDEVVQQNPLKKARVCVRARCDTPTMNDGCQWRKYGQKIAKGNPCPRAYYRCTVAASCPVRKQVQRCAEDMSILITTYEGTHNHQLPLSAKAMASTTSAAASMLLSGSSSSTSRATGLNPSAVITTTPANLHNLNFYLSDNSNSKQFYLHNSSLSPSPSHPTITLDLTNSNPSSSSHFNRFPSSPYSSIPKFAPSTLNFSSSTAELNSIPNWGSGFFGFNSTAAATTTTAPSSYPYNRSQIGGLNIGKSPIENNIFQSFMQNKKSPIIPPPQQDSSSSSMAAATKAITADPSFQSALAAALSSIIGNGAADNSIAQKFNWGEHFPVNSGYCATSHLNKTTANLQTGGSLMLLPASLPYASPKSNASTSPGDSKDHNT